MSQFVCSFSWCITCRLCSESRVLSRLFLKTCSLKGKTLLSKRAKFVFFSFKTDPFQESTRYAGKQYSTKCTHMSLRTPRSTLRLVRPAKT